MTCEQSGRTAEIELVDRLTGQDCIADIMGNSGDVQPVSEDDEHDAYWSVGSDEELDWWIGWAEVEQEIWDARDGADSQTVEEDDRLIEMYGYDAELLQEHERELFGIGQ